jgi:FdhD protein
MSKTRAHPEAVRYVRARRISTDDHAVPLTEEDVGVALEAAVTIDVEGVGTYTNLCLPVERRAMTLGFLFSEGLIDNVNDVALLEPSEVYPGVIRVKLAASAARERDPESHRLILSSCGACGSEGLDEKLKALRKVDDTLRIDSSVLPSVRSALRKKQVLFDACGGTHAAAVFDDRGELLAFAEDTGRHNALDQSIGKCLELGISTSGRGVMLSGRVSVEMVGKCARAGFELITAISAPTSLAVDVADTCGITLCAFVRETRATIFTHPERVIGRGGSRSAG